MMNFHNWQTVLVLTKTYWPSSKSGVELQVSYEWPRIPEVRDPPITSHSWDRGQRQRLEGQKPESCSGAQHRGAALVSTGTDAAPLRHLDHLGEHGGEVGGPGETPGAHHHFWMCEPCRALSWDGISSCLRPGENTPPRLCLRPFRDELDHLDYQSSAILMA